MTQPSPGPAGRARIDVLPGPPLAVVPDPVRRVPTGPAPVFHLHTPAVSYAFAVTPYGHLEHLHFGAPLGPVATASDLDPLRVRLPNPTDGIAYSPDDDAYNLGLLPLEWSGIGKGDHRLPPAEVRMPDGTFVTDFTYLGHRIVPGALPPDDGLPGAHADADAAATLVVTLADAGLELDLIYTVFADAGVLTRRTVLRYPDTDPDAAPAVVRRLMSLHLDLPDRSFDLVTFDGAALREARRTVRPVLAGTYVNQSNAGFSGNEHQAGVLLAARGADEDRGEVWGFNLVYSGNHHTAVELSPRDLVRVQTGINPIAFEWTLTPGQQFATPEAVLAWSGEGFNGLSAHFHAFVTDHIVPPAWARRERPIVLNTWEAALFAVDRTMALELAAVGRDLGVETLVLDDGWFGRRDDDRRSLGDWTANARRFPGGIGRLAREITALGLGFGLWVEPEMVNRDSELYRAHPDWAVSAPGRTPSEGRHQLLLDLTRADVRDHLVATLSDLLDSAPISYVKWDANRSFSDAASPVCPAGEFGHRYILGLYDVLRRVFAPRPDILLETCASGGNRFDLGMLCFGPQAWASDATDPAERLATQRGLSYLYPQSTWGAHVSSSPSGQTLRDTSLAARFNIAAFGVLGYELDLRRVSPVARRQMAEQVAFYKAHRRLLQFGRLRRLDSVPDHATLAVSDAASDTHVVGRFQTWGRPNAAPTELLLPPLVPDRRYRLSGRPQGWSLARFGTLLAQLAPTWLRTPALAGVLRRYAARHELAETPEEHEGTGAVLRHVRLAVPYQGRGYDPSARLLGDHSSRLYVVEPLPER